MEKLLNVEPVAPRRGRLNKLQAAQLQDSVAAGATVKVNIVSRSQNKGWMDTPLFSPLIERSQTKLF